MEPQVFRDWLADRVGDGNGKVSRRELARRLVVGSGLPATPKLVESQRRSIRRILNGEVSPKQQTRDSIQAALDDFSAPSVIDEDVEEPDDMTASIEALRRETEALTRLLNRRLSQVAQQVAAVQRRAETAA